MLRYALKALLARKARAVAIAVGFALSFATVLFSNAIASHLQLTSSAAIRFVTGDATLWITPTGAPRIDPDTQTLFQEGVISPSMINALKVSADPRIRMIRAEKVTVQGLSFVVYRDSNFLGKPVVSSSLAEKLTGHPVRVDDQELQTARVDSDLPGLSAVIPFDNPERSGAVSWVLVKRQDSKAWAREFAQQNTLQLADSTANLESEDGQGTIFLLSGSLSRIDPFSFRTKFAAFQLNAVTSSILGWMARIVFLFGAVLVVTSSRISVLERRPEVAALTALGYQSEFTILLLLENSILLLISLPVAICLGLGLSAFVLPSGSLESSLTASLGLTLFFAPIVLIISTLWAAQHVASRTEVSLVRSEY